MQLSSATRWRAGAESDILRKKKGGARDRDRVTGKGKRKTCCKFQCFTM